MGRIKKCFLLLVLVCICCSNIPAQNSAHKIIDSLYAVLKTQKEDTNRVYTLNWLLWHLRTVGEVDKAKELAKESIELATKLNYKRGITDALNNVANYDLDEGNYEKALENYNTCLSINEELGYKWGIGDNLINIGCVHFARGNYPEAAKYFRMAQKPYEESGHFKGMVNSNNSLGDTYAKQGNNSEALKYYLTALKISKKIEDMDFVAICHMGIGQVYKNMKNYTEALRNYQTSVALSQKYGCRYCTADAYNKIGEVYEMEGNYIDALNNHKAALEIYKEIGFVDGIGMTYNKIGRVHLGQANYSEALINFRSASEILEKTGFKEPLAVSYINMGETLSKQAALEKNNTIRNKKNAEALLVVSKGLSIAKNIGAKENIRNGYKALSDIYRAMNDFKNALDFNDIYVKLKDSLLNNETTQKLEQVRTQYEVEKAVEEEKIKNATAAAGQKAELKRKNELMLIGFGVFLLISTFVALLIRQRNLKRRAVERAQAGHKMAELELQSLRAQLNPHFMFNSLNAIQDLIVNENNEKSHLYLSRFSKLLRMLLDNANQPFVTVKQELELLELYLSLENLRIPNLQYSIEKDPNLNAQERMIPNMMLQPYIENAIWHGLSNKKGERKLQIRIHENGTATEFEVEDNGIGRKRSAELKQQFRHGHHSRGMQLLSKRFELLSKEYGTSIQTTITDLQENGDSTGTLVKIDVPFTLSEQAKQLVHDTNHHN